MGASWGRLQRYYFVQRHSRSGLIFEVRYLEASARTDSAGQVPARRYQAPRQSVGCDLCIHTMRFQAPAPQIVAPPLYGYRGISVPYPRVQVLNGPCKV